MPQRYDRAVPAAALLHMLCRSGTGASAHSTNANWLPHFAVHADRITCVGYLFQLRPVLHEAAGGAHSCVACMMHGMAVEQMDKQNWFRLGRASIEIRDTWQTGEKQLEYSLALGRSPCASWDSGHWQASREPPQRLDGWGREAAPRGEAGMHGASRPRLCDGGRQALGQRLPARLGGVHRIGHQPAVNLAAPDEQRAAVHKAEGLVTGGKGPGAGAAGGRARVWERIAGTQHQAGDASLHEPVQPTSRARHNRQASAGQAAQSAGRAPADRAGAVACATGWLAGARQPEAGPHLSWPLSFAVALA